MEELSINQSVYKRNEMKRFVVHICFLSLCNKAVGNEFFQKKNYVCHQPKLFCAFFSFKKAICNPLIKSVQVIVGNPSDFDARFGAPKNLRSLFPSEVTEPNSLALREGYLKAAEARSTNIKGNHTVVIVLLFSDVKAVIIFTNRQHSS